MSKAVVVTGATGYLGSHLVLRFLEQYPDHILVCISRNKSGVSARSRTFEAIRRAHYDQGGQEVPAQWLERVFVVEHDLLIPRCGLDAGIAGLIEGSSAKEFWHCAAAVMFADFHDRRVWNTNVKGLQNALALAHRMGIPLFNHISTAYVTGTLSGRIPETIHLKPERFNNLYEESKCQGESIVDRYCRDHAMAYRILRPSIIIGHSHTFRTSSSVGFYYFLELLRQFHGRVVATEPAYFARHPLRVRIDPEATLNLMPVDIVVSEMMDLSLCGAATRGQVFHITNESPLSLCDIVPAIGSLTGIQKAEIADSDADLNTIEKIFSRKMKLLSPYFSCRIQFDRSNVSRYGVERHQANYRLDLDRLKAFAQHYLTR